jgi:GNAT superfamily N-acetyltransferase
MSINETTYRDTSPNHWPLIRKKVLKLDKSIWGGSPLEGEPQDYDLCMSNPDAITHIAEDGEKLVGYANGIPSEVVSNWYKEDDGTPSDGFEKIGDNSLYCFCLSVRKSYEGRGIGTNLLHSLLKTAKSRGYKTVSGYCDPEASLHMVKKLNPVLDIPVENFGDSGKTYHLCVIDLASYNHE